jgi:hypothetical protein
MEEVIYNKICKYCGKEYQSSSRNARYCCQECCDKAQVKRKKQNKVRAKKRKAYDENKEINRALTKAYSLAHTVAKLYGIPKVCCCADEHCNGPLELNHKDLNPFNNSPWNLEYRCLHHHKAYHDNQGDVNMVGTFNEAVDDAGFEDDDKKYLRMSEYTKNKIGNARVDLEEKKDEETFMDSDN